MFQIHKGGKNKVQNIYMNSYMCKRDYKYNTFYKFEF